MPLIYLTMIQHKQLMADLANRVTAVKTASVLLTFVTVTTSGIILLLILGK